MNNCHTHVTIIRMITYQSSCVEVEHAVESPVENKEEEILGSFDAIEVNLGGLE